MAAPVNSDLPNSNGIPGTYVQIDLSGAGAASDDTMKRVLLLGFRQSTGTQPADVPYQTSSASEINTLFGRKSDVARMARAFLAQSGPGGADLWVCGTDAPSAGVASTHHIKLYGPATSAGSIDCWISGYKASASIANGDSAATVAAALKAEIDKLTDVPITTDISSDDITLTYVHKGIIGEDLPVRVNVNGATGIKASPGLILFGTTAADNGTCSVSVGGSTIVAALTSGDLVAAIATKVAAAINASGYPITAETSTATVILYYAKDRDVRRVSAVITPSGVNTTMNSVATASVCSVGTATSNTPGSGNPTLTTALSNIAGLGAFGTWVVDVTDSTSMGAISTHIELYANGYNQKDQVVHIGACSKLATAGAIPPASSPALTASTRYSVAWCPDFPQMGYELAARCAAIYMGQNYYAKNYDGLPLKTNGDVPLLLPNVAARPSPSDQNSALMTYYMTPIVVDSQSRLAVLRGRTTSNSATQDLWEWSFIRQMGYGRIQLRTYLQNLFSGKSFRRSGTPKTPNCFTTAGVKDAIYAFLRQLDDQDLYDGAEQYRDAIACNPNAIVPTRLDVFVPWAVIRPMHQIAPVIGPQF